MIKKVYIAGKVTGLPYDEAYTHFEKVEIRLRRLGFDVVNPTRIVLKSTEWVNAMRICIKELMSCDAIYMLKGYEDSRGARTELIVASLIGLPVDLEINNCYPFQNYTQN